jgi:hypothetical protein
VSARRALALAAALAALAAPPAAAVEGPPGSFELVGHDPLLARGMNSALALHGTHAYVGSRTDGTHPNAGVLVVDLADPARPRVVHEIGPPAAGNPGESSRELRVWPEAGLLLVLSFACDPVGHACTGALAEEPEPTVRFFDVSGEHEARPRLVATYRPSRTPHEMFLWRDPERAGRALLYLSTPHTGGEELLVTDVSGARAGEFRELASWHAQLPHPEDGDVGLHSLTVTPDGRRAHLAYLTGGYLVADVSDFAEARPDPAVRLVTPVEQRAHWGPPGAHSAVRMFGTPYALTTDEVYGRAFGLKDAIGFDVLRGCPWGWTRLIDVSDEARPRVAAEFRLSPHNDPDRCDEAAPLENEGASYSSHNPTLTRHLAFVSWHSAGLQAILLDDPERPAHAAEFRPRPLPAVAIEDVALTLVPRAAMWSFPIVKDGLVHVVDIRNGLYVLRYRGPYEDEVACLDFLEGNSNVGWPPPPCPLTLSERWVRTTRRGTVPVRVACLAREGECSGNVVLRAPLRPRERARVPLRLGGTRFSVPARTRTVVGVPLWRAGRAALARRGRMRVVAVATTRSGERPVRVQRSFVVRGRRP